MVPAAFDKFAFSHRKAKCHLQAEESKSNGMDAPAFYGINCAKVEVSSNHLNQRERPR